MTTLCQEIHLEGTPISRGIAIGRPFFFTLTEDVVVEYPVEPEEVKDEVQRYKRAHLRALEDIKTLQKRLQRERIVDGVAILDAHLLIMQDELFTTHVEKRILKQKKNAEYLFQCTIKEYQREFGAVSDPFFLERLKEIQDLSRRIMGHLRGSRRICLADIPQDSIIFAMDLNAPDIAEANSRCVGAFVTKEGGATSHAAIVAKAKGIPYVSSVDIDIIQVDKDTLVIVDGRTGEIILHPKPDTLKKYRKLRNQLNLHFQKLNETGKLDAETSDGCRILLSANVEAISEIESMHKFGGNGVGLLRTESTFLAKEDFPSEEEQFQVYRRFAEKMKGLPIVIRTFDLGGDKYLRNQQTAMECNPFLGCRAIRFSLREKDIFKIQLRAIWRAGAYGSVSVMFPMISSLSELMEAKEILEECRLELVERGVKIAERLPIGCMIEVPSAAIIADLLAQECDFLSIGTNDLVQYSLAVDRSNNELHKLYSPTHPSIIRLLKMIVSQANLHGIPVTVCGEVAADPRFTPLLLGLGVHELSVASRYIPVVKNAIRKTSMAKAINLAEQALTLKTAEDIEELLTHLYRKNVPDDCFYNC